MTAFDGEHVIFAESSSIQITNRQVDTTSDPVVPLADGLGGKEVCNRRVACSLLKLGSLEKTVIASLFHSGLHLSSPFFVEKTTLHELLPS